MFERISTTKLKLCKDARDQLGSLLVVIRNELLAGAIAGERQNDESISPVVAGSAENFVKQVEAIDRILCRLDQTFDTQKMALGYQILARATERSQTGRISSRLLNEATDFYGTQRSISDRYRIEDARYDKPLNPPGRIA